MGENFPQKNWTAGGLDNLLGRIGWTSEVTKEKGNRCKKEKQAGENMVVVEELILNQESQPGTNYSKWEIANLTDISSLLWLEQPMWIWTCKATTKSRGKTWVKLTNRKVWSAVKNIERLTKDQSETNILLMKSFSYSKLHSTKK